MLTSTNRLVLPVCTFSFLIPFFGQPLFQTFNSRALLELIKEPICIDKKWIPIEPGHSHYICSTLSAYSPFLPLM